MHRAAGTNRCAPSTGSFRGLLVLCQGLRTKHTNRWISFYSLKNWSWTRWGKDVQRRLGRLHWLRIGSILTFEEWRRLLNLFERWILMWRLKQTCDYVIVYTARRDGGRSNTTSQPVHILTGSQVPTLTPHWHNRQGLCGGTLTVVHCCTSVRTGFRIGRIVTRHRGPDTSATLRTLVPVVNQTLLNPSLWP